MQIKNFEAAVGEQAKIEKEVKTMLQQNNVGVLLKCYMIFAKQVIALKRKHHGEMLHNEIDILKNLWAGRGLNMEIMNKIENYYIPSYIIPTIEYFRLDISPLDGNHVLS